MVTQSLSHNRLPTETLLKAIEQTADHVMITDVQGIIVYVNAAFEKTTGYLRSEAIGQNPRILQSGRHGLDYYQRLWQTILSGQVFNATTINRKKDGNLYYADQSVSPIVDSENHVTHFVAVWKNATVRVLLEQELKHLSNTDEMTGIFNHRYFVATLEYEINRQKRYGGDLALLMIDVDNFKNYNDSLGHQEGDALLKSIAQMLKGYTRNVDVPCRYGGDEFAVILPHTNAINATVVANKIAEKMKVISGKKPITLSIGVAEYASSMGLEDLIKKADENLYVAKNRGRNNVFNGS